MVVSTDVPTPGRCRQMCLLPRWRFRQVCLLPGGFDRCVYYRGGGFDRCAYYRGGGSTDVPTTEVKKESSDVPSGGQVRVVSLEGCLASTAESSSAGGHSSSAVMSDMLLSRARRAGVSDLRGPLSVASYSRASTATDRLRSSV